DLGLLRLESRRADARACNGARARRPRHPRERRRTWDRDGRHGRTAVRDRPGLRATRVGRDPARRIRNRRAGREGNRVSLLSRRRLHDGLRPARRRRCLPLPVRGLMKITRIDTLRLDEFPSVVHVLVHTDEGLVGLGETFFFADAVEAHVHTVADYLLGRDPGNVEAHARALRGYVGTAGSGAEMRAASAIDIALWDLCGQAAAEPLHRVLG